MRVIFPRSRIGHAQSSAKRIAPAVVQRFGGNGVWGFLGNQTEVILCYKQILTWRYAIVVSYRLATRCAQTAVVLTLLAGAVTLISEARKLSQSPPESGDPLATITTKSLIEKKTNPKGPESTERREVTTAPNPNVAERFLGRSGLLVARMILLMLAAFVAGALVQRVLLGKFAFKAGGLELPEVQAPPGAVLPPSLTEAFTEAPQDDVSALTDLEPRPATLSSLSTVFSWIG